MKEMWERLLRERTGSDLATWRSSVRRAGVRNEAEAKRWLTEQGVVGYPRSLVVMECFGYPDFLTASANELLDGQYRDRASLRPIYEAVIRAARRAGDVEVQARKTYVSLLTPRRTFARVQPTTRERVDLGLRLEGVLPNGRLQPSKIHDSLSVQVGLRSVKDVDNEVVRLLKRSFDENR